MNRASKRKASSGKSSRLACTHEVIYNSVSPHARSLSYYACPSKTTAISAASRTGELLDVSDSILPPRSSFPDVNLLPQDHLDLIPGDSGDNLFQFITNGGRNPVTSKRGGLFVVDVPDINADISSYMEGWTSPLVPEGSTNSAYIPTVRAPPIEDIAGYLEAFYSGLAVRIMKNHFSFEHWTEKREAASDGRGHVSLVAPDGFATRVRFRPAPDGATPGQLNLNDMLDALYASIPPDAFAIILITNHDLYEDEEDDFCAGRAYGGSRISIVSTFRYHPVLDSHAKTNHAHGWPASHCRDYVDDCWEESDPALRETDYGRDRRKKRRAKLDLNHTMDLKRDSDSPLAAAVLSSWDVLVPASQSDWEGLWLARVCRTASHELGHCVGIGHCVYYSCVMQGSASVAEDYRQPPYLCPVCVRKVAYTLAGEEIMKSSDLRRLEKSLAAEDHWIAQSYRTMSSYCFKRRGIGMFGGFYGWLQARLRDIESPSLDLDYSTTQMQDEAEGKDPSVMFLGSIER